MASRLDGRRRWSAEKDFRFPAMVRPWLNSPRSSAVRIEPVFAGAVAVRLSLTAGVVVHPLPLCLPV
jgi:hypothetical protein